MQRLTDREWLILLRAPRLGPVKLSTLRGKLGSYSEVFRASRSRLEQCGLKSITIDAIRRPDTDQIEADQRWMRDTGCDLIGEDDERYPPQLRQIDRPPPALFVRGNAELLWLPQIAIVGSRNATRGGLENAREFAESLARSGLVVTSGLALGVDGAAHEAALKAGGNTIAVVGTGLDQVYPSAHRDLAHDVVERGCLVSEYLPGTPPRAGNFPARNRIISGLATGTLVVEAGIHSGSLITARLAAEQNREVFAIPGSIHNPLARGCHHLIKNGTAKLTETAEDLMNEIDSAVMHQLEKTRSRLHTGDSEARTAPSDGDFRLSEALDDEQSALLQHIGFDPISIDRIVENTGLTIDAVSSMLLILELDGYIESGPGSTYCRTGEAGE